MGGRTPSPCPLPHCVGARNERGARARPVTLPGLDPGILFVVAGVTGFRGRRRHSRNHPLTLPSPPHAWGRGMRGECGPAPFTLPGLDPGILYVAAGKMTPGSSPGEVSCCGGVSLRAAACAEGKRGPGSVIQEAPQLPAPAWVLQLPECLGLDLADAFAGDGELLADFFQRVIRVHADAEAHAQHAFFAGREARQHAGGGFTQVCLDGGVDRQDRVLVLDEVAEV
jgi:hypothetical protein